MGRIGEGRCPVVPTLTALTVADAELRWLAQALPELPGTARRGYPLDEMIPHGFPVVLEYPESAQPFSGQLHPHVAATLWDVLVDDLGTDELRLLYWVGWGTDSLFSAWANGVVFHDNDQPYSCYAGDRASRRAFEVEHMKVPFNAPSYIWPVGHRWFMCTHIDASSTWIACADSSLARFLLDELPLEVASGSLIE